VEVLVTGGAGFIGSNLVDRLLAEGHGVRILDDLTAGHRENVDPSAELVIGDVADEDLVRRVVDGIEVVFHIAAHRAVLRSVEHPLTTDTANIHGTLTVLKAAADAGVRRVVYSSSSSVYGGAEKLPTPEDARLLPRSPYAVTKLAGEHYCRVFSELFALETVALRYFNVYGPRQRSDSAYAAVIPLFIEALRRGRAAIIHGDGLQSRDFTYVEDAVSANVSAATAAAEACSGRAYNIAGGRAHSVLDLLTAVATRLGTAPRAQHADPRPGDVRHTRADIDAARRDLGHEPIVGLDEGLRRTVAWFMAQRPVSARR
jgi:nucleoside-diphosphate-sugar epimerase